MCSFILKLYRTLCCHVNTTHISKGFVSKGVLSPPPAFSFSCLQLRWHMGHVSLISIHFIIHLKKLKPHCSELIDLFSNFNAKCWFWLVLIHWHQFSFTNIPYWFPFLFCIFVNTKFRSWMIHLGGYNNCAICHTQLIAWEYVQIEQYCNLPNESSQEMNWVATRKHLHNLMKFVYWNYNGQQI